jgi:hypothetical protein
MFDASALAPLSVHLAQRSLLATATPTAAPGAPRLFHAAAEWTRTLPHWSAAPHRSAGCPEPLYMRVVYAPACSRQLQRWHVHLHVRHRLRRDHVPNQ